MLHHRQVQVKPDNPAPNQALGRLSHAAQQEQAAVHITQNEVVMDFWLEKPDMRIASPVALRSRLGFWRARCAPAFPGPLGGGEAGTIRPRSGRGQGWPRLFARAG